MAAKVHDAPALVMWTSSRKPASLANIVVAWFSYGHEQRITLYHDIDSISYLHSNEEVKLELGLNKLALVCFKHFFGFVCIHLGIG